MQALLHAGHDANSHDPCAPLPYCRTSQFPAASFARNLRFRALLRLRTFGGCARGERGGSTASPLRVLFPLTFIINGTCLGATCCCVFGYRLGLGYPVVSIPSPRPRRAQLWRDRAAHGGVLRQSPNRRKIDRIESRRRRPELPQVRLSASASAVGAAEPAAVCRAGRRRCTMPRAMAHPTPSPNCCCCAAPPGPFRTTTGNAALRRTANRPHSRARAGTR